MNAEDARYAEDATVRQALIDHLSGLVLERRLEVLRGVLGNRTRYIAVVLENIFQAHNASAVLRTCDCLGIQDVHAIEISNSFTINSEVDMSASKWLNIHRYSPPRCTPAQAIAHLRGKGYRIVATTPHANGSPIGDFEVERGKFALVFGTERDGLTESAMSLADEHVKIPMYGFIESYNISVSAALALYELVHKLRSSKIDYSIPPGEAELILLGWLKRSVKNIAPVEKRFLDNYCK